MYSRATASTLTESETSTKNTEEPPPLPLPFTAAAFAALVDPPANIAAPESVTRSMQFPESSSTANAACSNSCTISGITTTFLDNSACERPTIPNKESIGVVKCEHVTGHNKIVNEQEKQLRQIPWCDILLNRLQCEEPFRVALNTLSAEEFANLEQLIVLGAVLDVLDPRGSHGVPMLCIDRSRLRQLGYTLRYEGGRVSFVAVRDTFTMSNMILFEHDIVPVYTLRSYTMLKIQNTFTSTSFATTELPRQFPP